MDIVLLAWLWKMYDKPNSNAKTKVNAERNINTIAKVNHTTH